MTELQLYKFIQEFNPEYRWQENTDTKQQDVLIWVSKYHYEYFVDLLDGGIMDESSINCTITNGGYVAVWMDDICEYYGINIENIFKK